MFGCLWFRILGSGFRGFRVKGLRCSVWVFGFRILSFGSVFGGLGFRVWGFVGDVWRFSGTGVLPTTCGI